MTKITILKNRRTLASSKLIAELIPEYEKRGRKGAEIFSQLRTAGFFAGTVISSLKKAGYVIEEKGEGFLISDLPVERKKPFSIRGFLNETNPAGRTGEPPGPKNLDDEMRLNEVRDH